MLPLKPGMRGDAGGALRRRFEDIQPTLLLFLQRLRMITVRVEEKDGALSLADMEDQPGEQVRVMVSQCII